MLVIVVLMYKKGHTQASCVRYTPDSELLKIIFPIAFPPNRKNSVNITPRHILINKDSAVVLIIVEAFFSASAFAMAGNNNTDIELVIVAGNIMNGRAIPVIIPYIFSESDIDKPLAAI